MAAPKPVITYFGEFGLLTTVVQTRLQSRMKSLQLSSPPKEDLAFSTICEGVEFVDLQKFGKTPLPPYSQPALHTFWTECWRTDDYQSRTRPHIEQWLQTTEQLPYRADCLIVYCITPEVRKQRQRSISNMAPSHVEENMKTDFRGKEVFPLRLASSEEGRVLESLQAFCARLNTLCRSKFQRTIEQEAEAVAVHRNQRYEPEDLYKIFLQELNLAVLYEMTLRNEEALQLYQEASTDLEEAIATHYTSKPPPSWLQIVQEVPCTSWDYPKLVWHHLTWEYLPAIQSCSSPLLHIHTFFLVRISHLLFQLERAWTVSDLCIATLHSMAREMKMLQLPLVEGAFDCWAYMTCNEAVLAIMSQVNPDSLVDSTTSLLLVRAELWHYALEKLHSIGVLCDLMPVSNTLNRDSVLIDQLSNGITPVSFEVSSKEIMEDQGAKLREILVSKHSFKEAYLMLGEMVIGAFKHAGRRRMAFRVGTKMAKFHRDLGMMPEAEELLSDICRFYSEDQWLELSAPSYALLADCQSKLDFEDHLLLLASLPAYPPAEHNPAEWMEQLMTVADKSPYQKILTWSPLLELVKVTAVGVKEGGGKRGGGQVNVGDTVTLAVVIKSLAPKAMNNIAVLLTLLTRRPQSPEKKLSSTEQPFSPRSPVSPSPHLSSLEDLDLDVESPQLPRSRPIGEFTKARTTTTTHISSTSILEMESREPVVKLQLTARLQRLGPGENRVLVSGKVLSPGSYWPEKISLKCGALDFVTSHPSRSGWWEEPLTATEKKEELTISLLPNSGRFLAGYPQECTLTLETGSDTAVPQDGVVSLVTSSTVIIKSPATVTKGACDTEQLISFKLPSVPSNSHHSLPLTLTFPSLHLPIPSSQVGEDSHHYVWRHEVVVRCEWLSPLHEASLPVDVYEPLSLTYSEHSAGESTFLQLTLENTYPAPLCLRSPSLSADVSMTQLHNSFPEVLPPAGAFSCIWQATPGSIAIGDIGQATFRLQYKPHVSEQDPLFVDMSYPFPVSNMQTIFHTQLFTEALKDHAAILIGEVVQLKYIIRNVARGLTDTQLPKQLSYSISDPASDWDLKGSPTGTVSTPKSNTSVQICIQAVPKRSGTLSTPRLALSVPRVGSKVIESEVVLTQAQVYELLLGETVTVGESQ